MRGDGLLQISGHESLDEDGTGGVFPGQNPAIKQRFRPIIGEERANLVARQQLHFPGGAAHSHAHAIAVGIGGDDEVGLVLVGQLNGQAQGLRILRVGGLDRGEGAVKTILGRDDFKMETESLEHRLGDNTARPVDRGEDNAQGLRVADQAGLDDQGLEARHVGFVNLRAEDGDFAGRTFRPGRGRFAADGVHFGNDAASVRFHHLGSIIEVNFVTVIVRRIVAGGDDNARVRFQVTHGKGEFRSRARSFENKGVATVLRRDSGSQRGELPRKKAGVMRDDEFWAVPGRTRLHPLVQISHQALGGPADIERIHGVGAYAGKFRGRAPGAASLLGRGHDFSDGSSAQSACPEGERLIEAVVQL